MLRAFRACCWGWGVRRCSVGCSRLIQPLLRNLFAVALLLSRSGSRSLSDLTLPERGAAWVAVWRSEVGPAY